MRSAGPTGCASPSREIEVEEADAPRRLVWSWSEGDDPPTRVEFSIVAVPDGARVVVTETVPMFPLPALAAGLAGGVLVAA